MTEQTIITNGSEPLPGDLVGALLGFMQRLALAESADQVFAAFAVFAREEGLGEPLLEVATDQAPARWTAIEQGRLICYDDSRAAHLLHAHLAERGLPNAILWSTSKRPGAHVIGDAETRHFLRAGGISGGLFAAMQLPSGRRASAQLLAGPNQLDALPAISGDLFLVAAIQAFLMLDHRLGPVPPKGLTRREVEALRLSARGLTTRAIAEAMQISEATVKFHLVGARRKTKAGNTREAIAIFSNTS